MFNVCVGLQECQTIYRVSNTTAMFHKFTDIFFCITKSSHRAFQYSLLVNANITPLSHLYIWKPFVFVYLSQNGLCQRTKLTFQIHPSDPTGAATSVERSLTDNTLSETWVMHKLSSLCSESVRERASVNLLFGLISHSFCHILLS